MTGPVTEENVKTDEDRRDDIDVSKAKLIKRLRRLEGQVRGLQRMVEEERDCRDILMLLSGIRSALNAAGDIVLETYLEKCQTSFSEADSDSKAIIQAIKLARG